MQAESSNTAEVNPCPPRVVRCERVLRKRTKSVLLVLDRITDPHNEAAAHRCAEALGVQHVWTVAPPLQPVKKRPKRDTKSVAKGADGWLTLQRFDNVASCVSALRVEGWDIWCAADGAGAVELGSERPPELSPAKVAVVIGADAASSKVSTWSRRWRRDGASFSPRRLRSQAARPTAATRRSWPLRHTESTFPCAASRRRSTCRWRRL